MHAVCVLIKCIRTCRRLVSRREALEAQRTVGLERQVHRCLRCLEDTVRADVAVESRDER